MLGAPALLWLPWLLLGLLLGLLLLALWSHNTHDAMPLPPMLLLLLLLLLLRDCTTWA
jgi:hypothetical protein